MSTELLDRVNELRLEEDLTYADLAEQIGIDAGALYRILNGQVKPIDRTVFKVRRFLEAHGPVKQAKRRRTA